MTMKTVSGIGSNGAGKPGSEVHNHNHNRTQPVGHNQQQPVVIKDATHDKEGAEVHKDTTTAIPTDHGEPKHPHP